MSEQMVCFRRSLVDLNGVFDAIEFLLGWRLCRAPTLGPEDEDGEQLALPRVPLKLALQTHPRSI